MRSQDLLTKPIPSLVKQIAIPASTGIIFNTLFNVIDTFYASYISTNAVAGLSMSFFLYFMIIGIGYGFSSALTALVGNMLGKQKRKIASVYAHKGVAFIFFLGIFVGSLGFIFSEKLLMLMGAKEEYLDFGLKYIDIILLSSPFFLVNSAFNAILVAVGDTKTYRNMLIVGCIANFILDPLFIFGVNGYLKMGIQGLAFATILVQFCGSFFLGYKALKTGLIGLNLQKYAPKISIYKDIFNQGTPPALNMLTMSLGSVLIMYFVATYGVDAIAGFGIAFRVQQIILMPTLGLNSAVLSLVSNNFGAKLYKRVNDAIRFCFFAGFTIGFIGIFIAYIFGENLIEIFSNSFNVISFAKQYLYIEALDIFAYVTIFICVSTLQGIKKPKMIFFIGLYRQILAVIPICYLVAFYLKLPYIYLWLGLMFVVYSAAIFLAWHTKKMLKLTSVN